MISHRWNPLPVNYTAGQSNPTIHVPAIRCQKLHKDIRQCVTMLRAVAPGKLMLQNVYRLLRSRVSWSDQLVLDIGAREDLNWWLPSLHGGNRMVGIELSLFICHKMQTK